MLFRAPSLRSWAEFCRLHEAEPDFQARVVSARAEADLRAFAEFCHEQITDRDASFTLEKRFGLYRRWARSGQPCLVAAHDSSGSILACSIVLSLTKAAHDAFWFAGELDALEIDAKHLATSRAPDAHKYFLIDILARDHDAIRRLPREQRRRAPGLGFRTMIWHLSLFHRQGRRATPTLLCSTFNPELLRQLAEVGFSRRRGQGEIAAPICRLDTGQIGGLNADQRWLVEGALSLIRDYVEARAV
jgi:hypothetical protein